MFNDLLQIIHAHNQADQPVSFGEAAREIVSCVDRDDDFINTLIQIGTIPESIEHDSTEEKLFSKASDAVLARAFREIGLKATVLSERGDSADVLAESPIHGYSLVADSKAFRLSRTAKNQKDYKISALSAWRKDNDYAVLCAPYFQYPSKKSQIYAQALDNNVCLLSWEHFLFLISNGLREDGRFSFSQIWNSGKAIARKTVIDDRKKCILPTINSIVISTTGLEEEALRKALATQRHAIIRRSADEIDFWEKEIVKVQSYSREQAIRELINQRKIDEKIQQINAFVERIR